VRRPYGKNSAKPYSKAATKGICRRDQAAPRHSLGNGGFAAGVSGMEKKMVFGKSLGYYEMAQSR